MMSNRLTSVYCMLMLGLGIATGAGAAPSTNLVPNASFEDMTPIPTNVPPGGWEFLSFADHLARIQPDEAMVVEDPSQAHSGKRFLRLVPSRNQVVLRAPDPGHFDPGLYEVSAWVKGTPGVRGPMGLDVLGANFGAGVWTIGDDEWNKFTMIRYCNGVTNIQWRDLTRLGIGANQMEGAHFDIDDVSVTRLTSGLAGTFSDHMVLQRDKPVPVWGWAEHPGQQIKVQFHNQTKMVKANPNGYWMVVLDPMPAGGPYVLSLDGRPTAHDVMIGDVWVCIGQSNMDFGLNFVNSGYYGQSPDVLAAANHPTKRAAACLPAGTRSRTDRVPWSPDPGSGYERVFISPGTAKSRQKTPSVSNHPPRYQYSWARASRASVATAKSPNAESDGSKSPVMWSNCAPGNFTNRLVVFMPAGFRTEKATV